MQFFVHGIDETFSQQLQVGRQVVGRNSAVNPIFVVKWTHKKVFLCLIDNVYFRNSGRLKQQKQERNTTFPLVRQSKQEREFDSPDALHIKL